MAQFIPLTSSRHGNKSLSPIRSYAFAASASIVPIAATEFGHVASSMPIAFIEEAGSYKAVALLSPIAARNLFVMESGRWVGRYVPTLFRTYPFRLVCREPASDDWVLCIDEACPDLSDAGGDARPLFSAEGSLAPWAKAIGDLLRDFERGRHIANRAVAALAEAGALCPWEIKIRQKDGEQILKGLHRIDETALGKLNDEAFLGLRRALALPLAYAQLLSIAQLEVLQHLIGVQAEVARRQSPAVGPGGDAFNLTSDDSLHFS
jgi:hypothetical protein